MTSWRSAEAESVSVGLWFKTSISPVISAPFNTQVWQLLFRATVTHLLITDSKVLSLKMAVSNRITLSDTQPGGESPEVLGWKERPNVSWSYYTW